MTDLLRCTLPDPQPALADRLESGFLADAVLRALEAGRRDRRAAGKALARWFRHDRRLGAKDRPVVAEATYAAIRYENLLVRAGARSDRDLVDGVRRLFAGDRLEGLAALSPSEDYATALGLDYAIAREWIDVHGDDGAAALGKALSVRAPTIVRANRLRCTRAALAARLAEEGVSSRPCAHAADGLVIETRANLVGLESFRAGWFEVQDESSQWLIDAIDPSPGATVIDLCAGAGGKALALAARGARVRAWDERSDALDELERRAARAGAAVEITPDLGTASIVLVDAPCSGTGRLRRDPALRWGLEAGAHVETQRRLLHDARARVEPGGRLVYATCSLLGAENDHALEGLDPIAKRTLWPHLHGTDGFHWTIWALA
jgi:16S rRNA (cytosine967-C5)-methyltransferase